MLTSGRGRKRGKTKRSSRRVSQTLVISAVGCLLILLIVLVKPFYNLNLWASDQFFIAGTPSPNIVVVGIDDDTLATYGKWSEWPRTLHAQAVTNLKEAGAKVIAFDVVFADTSQNDAPFIEAITGAGNVVLAATAMEPHSGTTSGVTYGDILLPTPSLREAASGLGQANVIPDPDGKVRRLPLLIRDDAANVYPALSIAALQVMFPTLPANDYSIDNGRLHQLGRDIPADEAYSLRVDYSGAPEERPYLSYGDVISGNFPPEVVKNKLVLIGMTATGAMDTWLIPTATGEVSGVWIHAAAIDTILTQRFLIDTGDGIAIVTLLLVVAISALLLPLCGTWNLKDLAKGTGVTLGLLIAILVASSVAFDRGYLLGVVYPMLLAAVLYFGNMLYIVIIEQRDKRFVKELFGRYVSPEVARQVVQLADTGKLDLGGEVREVSILFADIRNFTQMTEQLPPEDTVRVLNTYLSVVVDTVIENKGIVNKFAGDNVMAVWNAPQIQPEHAELAVKTASETQQKIAELRQNSPGLPHVEFGIGVNTGSAVAGHVGSLGRAEYTVVGDAVNLASRICSAAPGDQIWIGPETQRRVSQTVKCESLGPHTFKGKAVPVEVFRVIG
ncbi:MAG: adenylate/guanylate cyclase domain-containing protein [Dehalococcoidales bacterium]|nr:adenylate/guanylate cyclase domain-containing protein [Dehalococcoidales bacterium]